jgi:hypothetical protein
MELNRTRNTNKMADSNINIPLLISLLEDSGEESDDMGEETKTVLM